MAILTVMTTGDTKRNDNAASAKTLTSRGPIYQDDKFLFADDLT